MYAVIKDVSRGRCTVVAVAEHRADLPDALDTAVKVVRLTGDAVDAQPGDSIDVGDTEEAHMQVAEATKDAIVAAFNAWARDESGAAFWRDARVYAVDEGDPEPRYYVRYYVHALLTFGVKESPITVRASPEESGWTIERDPEFEHYTFD